jgi:hypothetical protein
MTTVYLALRHRDPAGLRGLFARLIRWRLVTAYPHAGIVIGSALYHSTLADGVHTEQAPTEADGWLLLPTTLDERTARKRIAQRLGRRYDWISLLAFVLPVSVRCSRADYCFEFGRHVLTGDKSTGRVTAEQLAVLVAQQLAEELDVQHMKGSP